MRHEDVPERFNVASFFLDGALDRGHAERVALVVDREGDAPEHVSYAALAERQNRIGNMLLELGVRREERVLLALADGTDFVASWYAALKVGAVVAEVYTFLSAKDYAYYLDYARPSVVVCDETTLAVLREVRPPHVRTLVVAGEHGPLRDGEVSLEQATAAAGSALAAADTSRDDLALWKFTTGSTGAPKAAVHLQHDPLVSFEAYARQVLELDANDVVLPVPKLFFGYGRDLATLFPFGVGGCGVVFPERSTAERLFALIERHRPTILVNVPTMMAQMLASPTAAQADLGSLRAVVSSGETLPGELHRRWIERFGVEVIEGIGSSELYHIYVSNRPGQVLPGSAGLPVPGYAARLLDAQGAEVPDGEPGELWASGESAALCYWGDHARTKRTFHGDTVRTGDLFARDADGYLWYRGRADDLLKVGGIWVAPVEIEQALLGHAAVAECAVVGVERDGLAVACAFVVASAVEVEELRAHVRGLLSPHKVPREVVFVDELPKTANGKVDRQALRG